MGLKRLALINGYLVFVLNLDSSKRYMFAQKSLLLNSVSSGVKLYSLYL